MKVKKRNTVCLNQSLRLELDFSIFLLVLEVPSHLTALPRTPQASMQYRLKTDDPNRKLVQILTIFFFFLAGGQRGRNTDECGNLKFQRKSVV